MCGIAGVLNTTGRESVSREQLWRMISLLRHRGPDGFGFHQDGPVGLAHARLSIIDLEGGWQPIPNEDRSLWIVFNGEIFNYLELRQEMEKRGHRFSTKSDTEVIVHLYEEFGEKCVQKLNGQFAFAIWDAKKKTLTLARDRVGIRPLFYAKVDGAFLFASEIKALFADTRVPRELDPRALDQIFTFWMSIPPRTAFVGVHELPAGHTMVIGPAGRERVSRYWDPDFTLEPSERTDEDYAEELQELLFDATRLQIRADVPVGAYLSGGLDSSVITSLVKQLTDTPVRTFSVTFQDDAYDESEYQQQVISHLGTEHSSVQCSYTDIGAVFPEVVWHTEKPILRTAPAPLMILSRLVRERGYKVVLTGEGSDEILAGYDLFKEAKIRRFVAKQPNSKYRSLILRRLYPYLENSPILSLPYAKAFFEADTTGYPDACYAHVPRWKTTQMTRLFFSDAMQAGLAQTPDIDAVAGLLAGPVENFDPLSQAQYVEIKTLLSGYILSSQGDRVAMANSIECRFPFLDHRVMEFCFRLPPGLRMKALTEKYLLKKAMGPFLPPAITARKKQPFMAPDAKSFLRGGRLDYVEDLLAEGQIRRAGYFDSSKVEMLVRKCRQSPILGFKDNMALVGIISTMLVHHQFCDNFAARAEDAVHDFPEKARCHVQD